MSGVPTGVKDSVLEEQLADFGAIKRCFAVKKKKKNNEVRLRTSVNRPVVEKALTTVKSRFWGPFIFELYIVN